MSKSNKTSATKTKIAEQVSSQDSAILQRLEQRLNYIEAQTAVATVAPAAPQTVFYPAPNGQDCGCRENKCCCFDIYLSRVRVVEGQGLIEPADGAAIVSQFLELIFNVIADGKSSVYPSLTGHIQMSRKLDWIPVNKRLHQVSVKGTKSIPIIVEAREVETMALGGRPEFGTSNISQLNLACGCPVVPIHIKVELNAGGRAGGVVEVEIYAREACCDGC